jgi:carboxymethylenebutenolidase
MTPSGRNEVNVREIEVDGLRVLTHRPAGAEPVPGVVVLHEASGLNRDMRRIVTRLVSMGYAVAAPDLFSGGPRPLCIARAARDLLDPSRTGTTDRIERVRKWLASQPHVDGDRIGVIGFCMGGGFAVVAAARSPFRAAAVNYGRVPKDPALLAGSCPVVANYGAEDLLVPDGTVERYAATLSADGVPIDVEVFPGVGHSFMNREPAVLRPLRIAFDGPSAARAWARIEAFFTDHLGPARP